MSKSVAVVTSTIPITIDKFDRDLIRQVQAQGYDVCVVSSPDPELERVGHEMGVRVQALSMTREISPLADLIAFIYWLRLCTTERPAWMISATPKASLLSLLAGMVTRVPRRLYCVVGLRLEGEHGRRRQLLTTMEKLTSWASTDVVANSPSNGAIGSNHCQTLAHPGARRGRHRNVPPSERQSEATHGRIKRVLNINAGFLLCVLTLPTRLATATAMKTHDTQCLTDAIKTLLTHPATASHFGVEAHKWVVPALQPESVTRTLPAIVKAPDARGTLQNSEGNANAPKRQ